jgi:trigger factor
VETGTGLERRVRVQIPAARVEQELEARLKTTGATARLKGFRPGKVPAHVVEQRFGPQIRQEVVQDLVQSTLAEALAEKTLRPAGMPRIEMGAAEPGQDVAYTAVFEVLPEFRVSGLDTLSVERPQVVIEEADIDQTIERLRVHRATWTAVDRAAATGDRVLVDFTGTRAGQLINGGSGERVALVIGQKRMLPAFEAGLVGLSAGGSKSFAVTYPADFRDQTLRGAEVNFTVKAHEVAAGKLPAVDAEFVRAFDVASGDLAEFRRLVRENLESELADRVRFDLRQGVTEALLAANAFEVPVTLVNEEAAGLQAEVMKQLGVTDTRKAPALESFHDAARRRARLGLLFGALVQEHGLKADPGQIDRKLDEICAGYDQPAEVRSMYLQSAELMSQVESAVIEEQVVAWLLDRAKVTPRKTTFAALMGL